MRTDPNPAPPFPKRSLEPPPSAGRTWVKWLVVLAAINLLSMLWLSVRAESPPSVRKVLDAMSQAGVGLVVALFAYRALAYYPFRLLELLAIVIVLSLGVWVSMDAREQLAWLFSLGESAGTPEEQLGAVLQASLLSSSVLWIGAALGLRYCKRLRLDGTLARLWAVICGTLVVPAVVGFLVFPLAVLQELLKPKGPGEQTGTLILLWMAACVLSSWNAILFIRSLSLSHAIGGEDSGEAPTK